MSDRRYRLDHDQQARLDILYEERVRGQQCPDCGGVLELEPQRERVVVSCDCGWWEVVA